MNRANKEKLNVHLGEALQPFAASNALNQVVKKQQGKFFARLLMPSLILLTALTLIPVIYLIITSFTSWDLSRPGSFQFIGLGNFNRILTGDPRFWNSVLVQVELTFMTVPTQIIIGLALAVFTHNKIKSPILTNIARSVFILPMVIPPIVAALIWKILFTPQVSILSFLSENAGLGQLAWLGNPHLALVAIAIASIWELFPYCFLLLYAGLLSLPEEPLESARIDGASGWQEFYYISLPMLRPVISIVLLFRIIDSIRTFPMIYLMTSGGPGFVTEPTNFYVYLESFSFSYMGYSSAIIIVMFIFTMLITAFILRNIPWNRREE